jgi:hypothetical protein
MPASVASSAIRSVVRDASSGGLITTEFPVASAGPIFHASMAIGKFHGSTPPTTPTGSRTISPTWSASVGDVFPKTLSAASAYHRRVFSTSGMSKSRQSVIGLPASIASVAASSSALASMRSASRNSVDLRSPGAILLHCPASKAARAAATARSTSSSAQAAISAITWPVAGATLSKVVPSAASTKEPPIPVRKTLQPAKAGKTVLRTVSHRPRSSA